MVFIRLNILQRIWFPFWYPGRDRISNFFLPQLTTAIRYTLSYICSRGLTCIYTRREEIPEERSGDEIKIGYPAPEVLSEEHSKRNRPRDDVHNWWAYPFAVYPKYMYQMMPTTCRRIMRFCEQERPWPSLVLEKFTFELSRFCRHMYIDIYDD